MSTHNSHTTTVSEGVLPGPAINTPARVSSKPKRLSSAKQRKLVEAAIERLVELLDDIDPDPESEPSLGWPTDYEFFPQVSGDRPAMCKRGDL